MPMSVLRQVTDAWASLTPDEQGRLVRSTLVALAWSLRAVVPWAVKARRKRRRRRLVTRRWPKMALRGPPDAQRPELATDTSPGQQAS